MESHNYLGMHALIPKGSLDHRLFLEMHVKRSIRVSQTQNLYSANALNAFVFLSFEVVQSCAYPITGKLPWLYPGGEAWNGHTVIFSVVFMFTYPCFHLRPQVMGLAYCDFIHSSIAWNVLIVFERSAFHYPTYVHNRYPRRQCSIHPPPLPPLERILNFSFLRSILV